MKVFIILILFLIDVIFKTFGYKAEPPAFNVYVHVKPKCLVPNEQVDVTVKTPEYQPHKIDVTCGIYSNLGPYTLRKCNIQNITLTYEHKKKCNQGENRIYNVSNDCKLNLFQRSVFFYTYSVYNYFCDES